MAETTLPGTVRQGEWPVWQPLVDLVSEVVAEWFMWMYEIELADGSPLHAYKHVATRQYLHLTEGGRAFVYVSPETYLEIPPRRAVREAVAGWDELLPQPDDPDAVREALRRACGSAVI